MIAIFMGGKHIMLRIFGKLFEVKSISHIRECKYLCLFGSGWCPYICRVEASFPSREISNPFFLIEIEKMCSASNEMRLK